MTTSTNARPAAKQQRLVLDFEDNRLLSALYGQHDAHLARIEQLLDVSVVTRGNRVAIEGARGAVTAARDALTHLYDRLKEGEGIDAGAVDGAVRLAEAGTLSAADGGTRDGGGEADESPGTEDFRDLRIATRNRLITPRSPGQARYIQKILANELVFAVGPAGTGKTYLAVAVAVSKMMAGEVDRLILSRPAVEAGENLGFLPGDLKEKVDPYLRPLYDALYDMLPAEQVEKRLLSGQIEIAPLAYMRGRTLSNAFVILDEAQNTTPMQMKMFLTRLGENSRMVVAGDATQVDLPQRTESGLNHAIRTLRRIEGIGVAGFDERDVVRHALVGRIVNAYEQENRGSASRDESA